MSKHLNPFNTALETGVRLLFVLDACSPATLDLQRLIYVDYLLVHSSDFPSGPPSIHPATPYRSGSWLVRRQLVADGLELMFAKELLTKRFTEAGIDYAASPLTAPFLQHLSSIYSAALTTVARWLAQEVVPMSSDALRLVMEKHVGEWGAEFRQDPVFAEEQQ
jgi:hypothetical protein